MNTQAAIWAQSPSLKTLNCQSCGKTAEQVIDAENRIRLGWYCPICKHFQKAILRERTVKQIEGHA